MTSVQVDASQFRRVAKDIGAIPAVVAARAEVVVAKAALNVKEQLRREAESNGTTRHFSRSITYDIRHSLLATWAEIGPDKALPQGSLGNILYFGSSRTGPVLPDPQGALDAETGAFERHLLDIAEREL